MRLGRRAFVRDISIGALLGLAPATAEGAPNTGGFSSKGIGEPWLRDLAARHKQFFDVSALNGGNPLRRAASFLDIYHSSYGLSDGDVTVVFGAHSGGLAFILGDRSWASFGLGRSLSVTDPASGNAAERNIFAGLDERASSFAPSVKDLQRRGVRFLACQQSIIRLATQLELTTQIPSSAIKDSLLADLLPGVTPVPAMIVATNRAQEAGLAYAYLG